VPEGAINLGCSAQALVTLSALLSESMYTDDSDRKMVVPARAAGSVPYAMVKLSTGVDSQLNVLQWSERGPACILVHGLGDAACVWNDFATRISGYCRTVAPDLRGHGRSSWADSAGYAPELMVADLLRVMDAFGGPRPILVGHSWGGDIAMRVAALDCRRISAVVLVDIGPECDQQGVDRVMSDFEEMPWRYDAAEQYAQWLAERRPLAMQEALHELAHYSLRRTADNRFELTMDPALRSVGSTRDSDEANRTYNDVVLWAALDAISCPVLVVRGVGSSVLRRDSAKHMVNSSLANGRLVEVDNAGHSVMIDNPNGFHAAVATFIGSVLALNTKS